MRNKKFVPFSRKERKKAQSGGVAGVCFAIVGFIIFFIAIKAMMS